MFVYNVYILVSMYFGLENMKHFLLFFNRRNAISNNKYLDKTIPYLLIEKE